MTRDERKAAAETRIRDRSKPVMIGVPKSEPLPIKITPTPPPVPADVFLARDAARMSCEALHRRTVDLAARRGAETGRDWADVLVRLQAGVAL